jgi:SAM-dependent methyltransferase
MEDVKQLTHCLACGSNDLTPVFDLGSQPLANSFVDNPAQPEATYPLAVNYCEHCHHLQLTHAVNPELIYKNYLYVSGTSQTLRDHSSWFARWSKEQIAGRVLDIGCNDGTQLDAFKAVGYETYGVDPAENLHPISSKNHDVYCGFWDDSALAHFTQSFDVVTAQNSFAHNPDPVSFLRRVKQVLTDQGRLFIQTSQADMVLNGEFDTIYHEHINFYNINSMNKLCQRAGLNLVDVIKTPVHGTSYIFVIAKNDQRPEHINNLIALEAERGLLTKATYTQWATDCRLLVEDLQYRVEEAARAGYIIAGYGAAAKGNTLLNYSHLPMDFVIDDNKLKQDKFTPGTHIPVVPATHLNSFTSKDKIMFIPLAWNFYTEIKAKILLRRFCANDKFVRYFPEVTVE